MTEENGGAQQEPPSALERKVIKQIEVSSGLINVLGYPVYSNCLFKNYIQESCASENTMYNNYLYNFYRYIVFLYKISQYNCILIPEVQEMLLAMKYLLFFCH